MNVTISDRRDLGAFIPSILDDFGLDVYSFRIYCRVAQQANNPKGCFESINSMAKALKIDRKTIIKSLKLLLCHKLIEKEVREGYSSVYRLTSTDKWIKWGDLNLDQTSTKARF